MTRNYIIVADDSIKGFDEGIEKLEREWGAEEIEPCEDCISREDAMSMILCYGNEIKTEVMNDIKASMIKLPPVTPQPKIGWWLKNGELCKCSNCHSNVLFSAIKHYNFCPNCGTMNGREAET